MKDRVDIIILSDPHFGRKDSKAKELRQCIDDNPAEKIVFNGDIFDWWHILTSSLYRKEHHSIVRQIWRILKERGTKIHYNVGNHDWFMAFLIPIGFMFGVKIRFRLKIGNYLIEHGNLIHLYLKRKGLATKGNHRAEYYMYAILKGKTLIVGHSHWPINIDDIVIDEGDWVKHNTYLTINNEVSELKKY